MKFLIADDHEMFLKGMEFILKKEYPDVELTLTKSYTGIFEELEHNKNYDLIITDLAMPGANWYDALQKIHEICSETPIVIISAVFDRGIVQKTFDIGVSGYISKSFSNNIIISAINLVLAGGMYIPAELLRDSVKAVPELQQLAVENLSEKQTRKDDKLLTSRQLDVLRCVSKGLSNKQIAYELGLQEGTVKIHITLLMRSLGVSNRMSAVREAMKLGILNIEK